MSYDTTGMSGGRRKKKSIYFTVVVVLVTLVGVLIAGGMYLGSVAPKVDAAKFSAGEGFTPGEKQKIYGSETEAYLDGLEQRVSVTDPSDKWKAAFPKSVCKEQKGDEGTKVLCSAAAPAKLKVDNSIGYKLDSVMGSFGIAGGIAGLLGMVFIAGLGWILLNEWAGEKK